jgi:iron complex transport system substrate-binding protein
MRLVSICPSNTEILFGLGLGQQIIGIDDWSDWPAETAELPRVGPDLSVYLDRVEALKPDLVLASLSVPGMERNVEGLQKRGLPHLVLAPESLGDVLGDIEKVGAACGVTERAAAMVAEATSRIERVRHAARLRPQLRVYWEWWPKPMVTAGARSWVNEMIGIAGGVNIFRDLDLQSAPVEPLEVVRRDPQLLMVCWCGTLQRLQEPGRISARPGWDSISGVAADRIICVPEGLFGRPSQRLVDGLEMLDGIIRESVASFE